MLQNRTLITYKLNWSLRSVQQGLSRRWYMELRISGSVITSAKAKEFANCWKGQKLSHGLAKTTKLSLF